MMEKKVYDLKVDPDLRGLMHKPNNKGGGRSSLEPKGLYEYRG